MTTYIKLATLEYPRYQGDIRLEHREIGLDFVCPDTYAEVQETQRPDFNMLVETAVEIQPTIQNGVWVTNAFKNQFFVYEWNGNENRNDINISNNLNNVANPEPQIILNPEPKLFSIPEHNNIINTNITNNRKANFATKLFDSKNSFVP